MSGRLANQKKELSFYDKENICDFLFNDAVKEGKQFWHVCTPGSAQELILTDNETCQFAMNAVWMSTCDMPELKIYTFEWMSNHFHALISGTKKQASDFVCKIRKRLGLFFTRSGFKHSLDEFVCSEPIRIDNLLSFRNTIIYINRNNYVIDSGQTPFSYPYGANSFFFNPLAKRFCNGKYGDLTVRAKRKITHSGNVQYPGEATLIDGYISPAFYCDIDFSERMFRDARHYFSMLSRQAESSNEIAKLLGDKIYYTDDELYAAITSMCRKNFGMDKPQLLDSGRKIEFAKLMHYDYNASNGQIQRILRLDRNIVDALFPMSKG